MGRSISPRNLSGAFLRSSFFFFFQAEDGIRDYKVTGVQTCALPIWDLVLKKAGAESNASTNSDRTTYYEVFSKEDLEAVMKLEADRFQHLLYPEAEIGRASCRERV